PAALASFRFGGVGYALPWLTDVPLLYFRTDTAGVPVSLDDLFAKGGASVLSADTVTLAAWWTGQGGRFMNGGNPVMDDSVNVVFLQQLKTWRNDKVLRIDPSALTAFAEGKTPYVIAGASQASLLTQANVPWGSIQLADLVGGQGKPLLGMTLGIANSEIKTTEAMKPAIEMVEKALLTPEVEGALLKPGSLLPANTKYYQTAEAQKGVFPQAKIALAKASVLEGNAPEWKLIPLQDKAWNDALAGNASPQDSLTSAQGQAVKVISAKGTQ
ncbi:MAG: extracellular solute-binding protein, partial [Bacillota bacterium]|nr:extracellular solute-binding protein [Bacillota bacterium]